MKRNRGFTLFELTIVLGLLTILATGLFLSTRSNYQRDLHNASLLLQADFRYAQRRAMIEGRRYGVFFNITQNRYYIALDTPREVIRTVYLQNGVHLRETSGPRLLFLPRGTASSGFRVTLNNGPYSQQLTATVSGGRIRIFDIERR